MPLCNGTDRGTYLTRKRADFPLVSRHERVCQTDWGGKADDSYISWCGFPLQSALAANAYREGAVSRL